MLESVNGPALFVIRAQAPSDSEKWDGEAHAGFEESRKRALDSGEVAQRARVRRYETAKGNDRTVAGLDVQENP